MEVLTDHLTDWMRRQRWFGNKERVPRLRHVGSIELESDEPDVIVRSLFVLDESGSTPALYQVPVTVRDTIPRGWGQHFIGRVGEQFIFDGVHDPAFVRALVELIARDGSSRDTEHATASARGHSSGLLAPAPEAEVTGKVLSGEQSNTSIIITISPAAEGAAAQRVMCKIFRTLHHGENPDVVLQSALSAAGSPYVPASLGSVSGEWPDPGRADGRARGHLAFAQEFLPGVEDAWRVTLEAARAGVDFSIEARALGEATADVHATLARALPSRPASLGDVVASASAWRRRLAVALAEVPEIAPHRDAIEAVYDAAQAAPWPALQRIHGDYHLGQVLSVPDRGWVLLDFEGEPLRPMSDRDQPDSPLRDVAGMLRSFDYVAGATSLASGGDPGDPTEATLRWAARAREAFLEGYLSRSGLQLETMRPVLDAFEVDKAVYEAVYERRNRPDWLSIPITAIARLAGRAPASTRG